MHRAVVKRLVPAPVWNRARDEYYATREHGWLRSQLRSVVAGHAGQRLVALTFDDGPHPVDTPRVLDVLARHAVPATFFLLGRNVAAHPRVARQVVEAGHAVGNHTYDHPHLPSCSVFRVMREVRRCQRAIRRATGVSPTIMRPPFGAQHARAYVTLRALGYDVIHWSASGHDWLGESADAVADRVLSAMAPGRIVLLHDNLEPLPGQTAWPDDQATIRDRGPTIAAVERIIETLRADGYRFVTVPQMLEAGPAVRRSWFY